MDISEDILIKASQGDMRSFEELYKASSGFVYNVAWRIVSNREDAQEVVQEVFLIIHRKLKDFRFESSFKTWAYRITSNCAINHLKRVSKNRNRTVEYDDSMASTEPDDMFDPMDREHEEKKIESLLASLNPEQRACVVLRGMEGLSYQEIARSLDININTVRTRLKRAREKMIALRKQVDHEHV